MQTNYSGFSGAPLFDKISGAMIVGGQNGVLYLGDFNTEFDYVVGTLSITPKYHRYTWTAPGQKVKDTNVEGSVAMYGPYAYFGDSKGVLQCVDVNTLKSVWAVRAGEKISGTPALDMSVAGDQMSLYAGSLVGGKGGVASFFRYDALSGKKLWQFDLAELAYTSSDPTGFYASPVIGQIQRVGHGVLPPCHNGTANSTLYALSKADGSVAVVHGVYVRHAVQPRGRVQRSRRRVDSPGAIRRETSPDRRRGRLGEEHAAAGWRYRRLARGVPRHTGHLDDGTGSQLHLRHSVGVSRHMKIYLDAMGGDHAPEATALGAQEALRRFPELTVELGGPKALVDAAVAEAFKDTPDLKTRLTVSDCPELIATDEAPVIAVRQKKQSAIVDGMLKLRDRQVDAFVSAGSTGAVLAGGMFRLGRIKGIDRPALAPLLPNGKDYFLLIDCGANVDCRPEYLLQFAQMGDAYMRGMRGMK